MQSANQAPTTGKKLGHVRRQSYGKIMPISAILDNLIGPNTNPEMPENEALAAHHSPLTQSIEAFALNDSRRVNERSDGDSRPNITDVTLKFINHEKIDEISEQEPLPKSEIDIEKTFLKCVNYHRRESEVSDTIDEVTADPETDEEDDIDRLLGNNNNAPCLMCTNKGAQALKHSLMNVLCKKLCDESCNTSTISCHSNDDLITHNSAVSAERESDTGEGNIKVEPEHILQRSQSSRQEFLASMLEKIPSDHTDTDEADESLVAPLTMENLKQFNDDYFREKLAIAEALANTSMMTSSAAKSRLAARKIEMSLNTPDFVYDPENAEYIPPKELLMYLVR